MPFIVPTPSSTGTSTPTVLSDLIWAYLPGYMKSSDDGTLRALVDAIALPVADRVRLLSDPAHSSDEYTAPFDRLAWLAAMAGVDLSTIPDSRKRAVLADPDYRYRGSETAIRKRVGETLTGARSVEITCPLSGDPDAISVTTFASQTPDAAATEAAIRAEIPAWMAATIVTNAAGQSYTNLAADYATYGVMTATGKSYGTLSQEI